MRSPQLLRTAFALRVLGADEVAELRAAGRLPPRTPRAPSKRRPARVTEPRT